MSDSLLLVSFHLSSFLHYIFFFLPLHSFHPLHSYSHLAGLYRSPQAVVSSFSPCVTSPLPTLWLWLSSRLATCPKSKIMDLQVYTFNAIHYCCLSRFTEYHTHKYYWMSFCIRAMSCKNSVEPYEKVACKSLKVYLLFSNEASLSA